MAVNGCEIGIIGLGVMGRNLLLNMAEHGFTVAGYDRKKEKAEQLKAETQGKGVHAFERFDTFFASLREPRVAMLMVTAGAPVDDVLRQLEPHLRPGDILIDGGNSHFRDTDRRAQAAAKQGIQYLGVGISGGESGARHGPSIMPGGPRQAAGEVLPVFRAIAAKVDGDPCVTYLGPGSAGHYVKMVHNAIEYGVMQLIAETYDLMKRGLGLSNDELASVYAEWGRGELSSFLLSLTAEIFKREDERTGGRLIDKILDEARQLGTGSWASQDAMELEVPVPTLDAAVALRSLSVLRPERKAAANSFPGLSSLGDERDAFLKKLRGGLYLATLLAYAQGMALLHRASQTREYGLKLDEVARIWRGGCIIRAALLEPIRSAFQDNPVLPNLLLAPAIAKTFRERVGDLRAVVSQAVQAGIPVPGLSSAIAYLDAYRSAWLPANLIQAQRDAFGSHQYERIDVTGKFHSQW
jgi:6-phosphogluconate dehydrogenase